MNSHDLMVQARAKIIWGESPLSVRCFLTSNGMAATEAEAKIQEFVLERNAEIRRIGVRKIVIGSVLVGLSIVLAYELFTSFQESSSSARSGGVFGLLALMFFYGLWKLVDGIVYLVRPRSEHGSIPDISE